MLKQMMSSPEEQEGAGEVEAQLVALLKQAKALADQNGIDFQALLAKAMGGRGSELPPPPVSAPPM